MSAPEDDLAPALIATGVWLGVGAALDVGLVATGRRPMTHFLRTPTGVAFLVVLNLHVADRLGPLDPFRWAGRGIGRWARKS